MQKVGLWNIWHAAALVFGTIVGAGVLGLPYALAQTGLLAGIAVLVVAGSMLTLLMLFLGEVSLRSKEKHQLTGYAKQHLGNTAKHILALALVVNIYGAMLAYTIGQGEVIDSVFGGNAVLWSSLFFGVGGVVIALGINVIKYVEAWLTIIILALLSVVMVLAAPSIEVSNLAVGQVDASNLLVVYGIALFACFGLTAVPQARDVLFAAPKRQLRTALVLGGVLPLLIYSAFAVVVVGVTGTETTAVATIGLGEVAGPSILLIGSVFAFFAMTTSFLALGLALRNVFHRDYGLSVGSASLITVSVPALLFAFGVRDFISVLSVVGGFALGIVGIVGTLTYLAARRTAHRPDQTLVPHTLGRVLGVVLIVMFVTSLVFVVYDTVL